MAGASHHLEPRWQASDLHRRMKSCSSACISEERGRHPARPQSFVDFGTPQQGPWDWSRDGKYCSCARTRTVVRDDCRTGSRTRCVQKPWLVRNAQFSPDGKFVAYASSETGNSEVYVSPFPGFSSKWQVSRGGGGEEPRWRRDGKELFYLAPGRQVDGSRISKTSRQLSRSGVARRHCFTHHPRQPVSRHEISSSYDVTGGRSEISGQHKNGHDQFVAVVGHPELVGGDGEVASRSTRRVNPVSSP